MHTILKFFIFFYLITSPLFAEINPNNLKIGGNFLGIYNSFEKNQTQFDFASNIDFNYKISPNLEGIVQFQSSPGNGSIGFAGPNVTLTDISLNYNLVVKNHTVKLTFGSFDTPFGYETNFLTNNADAFNNLFILNSLTYSALGGPVGTLNTLGVKAENKLNFVDITTAVSNGTSETAYNTNSTLERVTQLSFHSFIKGLRLTGTYLESNDQSDTQDSLQADLLANMIEFDYSWFELITFKLKRSEFKFDDKNNTTEDQTFSYDVEVAYTDNPFTIGIRGSFWRPQGASMSSSTPAPGLTSTGNNSDRLDRYQVSFGYYLEENVLYKLALISEKSETNQGTNASTNTGLISGFNVRF